MSIEGKPFRTVIKRYWTEDEVKKTLNHQPVYIGREIKESGRLVRGKP